MISKDGLSPLKRSPLAPTQSDYHSSSDMGMIHNLLKTHSLYNIPNHLRAKVIKTADRIMDDEDPRAAITGARVILECDKRNIDVVKLAIPKKVEVRNIQEQTTEELHQLLKDTLRDHPELIPVEVTAIGNDIDRGNYA